MMFSWQFHICGQLSLMAEPLGGAFLRIVSPLITACLGARPPVLLLGHASPLVFSLSVNLRQLSAVCPPIIHAAHLVRPRKAPG